MIFYIRHECMKILCQRLSVGRLSSGRPELFLPSFTPFFLRFCLCNNLGTFLRVSSVSLNRLSTRYPSYCIPLLVYPGQGQATAQHYRFTVLLLITRSLRRDM